VVALSPLHRAALPLWLALAGCATQDRSAPGPTPQEVVAELLAADRAFGAAGTDPVAALGAMLAEDVIMPAPPGRFLEGRTAVLEAVGSLPDHAGARLTWAPIRGGISSDGLHGFTFGYMILHRADGAEVPLKYLAYWVKGPAGWRVAAYKRRPRPAGEVSLALLPAALPAALEAATGDTAVVTRHRLSLDSVERAFSEEAQRIGLGAAFARYGSPDAMNMGGPDQAGFVFGADSIAVLVSAGEPASGSSVSWAPDHRVIVASSGDLGITFGLIRPNTSPEGGNPPAGVPFFTIWRRAGPGAPWRYVAE